METPLGQFIQDDIEPILQDWEKFARSLVPDSGLDSEALRDHAKQILLAVVDDIASQQTPREEHNKSRGLTPDNAPALKSAAESHAVSRMADQFSLNQLVAEFRAIRASVLRRWAQACSTSGGDGRIEELTRFNEAIDEALAASMAYYNDKLEEACTVIIGMLAHDLRNPLGAIAIGTHFILRCEPLDPRCAQAAARTLNSVSRMTGLVDDLLDYTRTRLGSGLPVAPRAANLEQVCRDVVAEVEAANPGRTVQFSTSGDTDGEWDPARLAQLLTNLLTNALHHGDRDQPVRLTLAASPRAVTVDVANRGAPIPLADRPLLFQPLQRSLHGAARAPQESSGLRLGLYIAAQIANAHRGQLSLAESNDQQTRFSLSLPRRGSTALADGVIA